jgi:hypothetical protein
MTWREVAVGSELDVEPRVRLAPLRSRARGHHDAHGGDDGRRLRLGPMTG